jgi:hypothetical protein
MAASAQIDQRARQWLLSPVLRIALAVGLAIHLIGFLVFRVASHRLPTGEASPAFLRYVSTVPNQAMGQIEEQALLFDSAPLFIPTQWNGAQTLYTDRSLSSGVELSQFEPPIDLLSALAPANVSLTLENQVVEPVDLLDSRFWDFFVDFGAVHKEVRPYVNLGPTAMVRAIGGTSMQLPAALEWPADEPPPGPVRFYLHQAGTGRRLSGPILAQSSESAAFDQAVQAWLNHPQTRAQLPSGYLEVTVYPE